MPDNQLHILVIGAHPDDCEYKAAGTAALYRSLGHRVKFVSVTNGDAGHQKLSGEELATIRKAETDASSAVCGVEYEVLNNHDGQLLPTMENRLAIIRLIRRFEPDLVLTHRPNDYHPDHRYTSQLVCDAAYMVTVPPVAPDVPHLRTNPVFAYLSDDFQKPYAFTPDVVVDIEPVLETAVDMLHCHKSQFYDWLAYNHGYEDELPESDDDRRGWMRERLKQRIGPLADRFRDTIIELYGEDRGRNLRFVEAFEVCEYGAALTNENRRRLFPFLPNEN